MKSTLPKKVVTIRNRLEEKLGSVSDEQRQRVFAVLRTFMDVIRALLNETKKLPRGQNSDGESLCESPRPECVTCAFNRETDSWPGAAATTYGLMWALGEGKLFMCHSNQPEFKAGALHFSDLILCEGFVTLHTLNLEKANAIAEQGMEAINRILAE